MPGELGVVDQPDRGQPIQRLFRHIGPEPLAGQTVRQRGLDAGLEAPPQPMETGSSEFLRALVSEGEYLSLLPTRLVHAELRAGLWVRLDAPGFSFERPVMLYTREGEPQSAPLLRLLQALRNAAGATPVREPGDP